MTIKLEYDLELSLDEAVLRYKFDCLFKHYGLPVIPFPFEYTGEDWKRLAHALTIAHEPAFKANTAKSSGRRKKWTQTRLFHLLACVEAVKRQRGVKNGRQAIKILTTEFRDGLGPQNRKNWKPSRKPATKAEALAQWQGHLEKRLSEAREEFRRWEKKKKDQPKGLLHTLRFPGIDG